MLYGLTGTIFLRYHQSKYKKQIDLIIQVYGSVSRAWVNQIQESDDCRDKSIAVCLIREQSKMYSPAHAVRLLYSTIGRQAVTIHIRVILELDNTQLNFIVISPNTVLNNGH
jgi:hypothetical protein